MVSDSESLQLGLSTSLLIKIGTITVNTCLPTRNKFSYSCSIQIHASGSDKLLNSIFCILLVVEVFSLPKAVKMSEEVAVSWQEVRWIGRKRQNFVAEFIQLLKPWLCDVRLGVVVATQCQLQVLGFSEYLIEFTECTSQMQCFPQDSESCHGLDRQQTTRQWLWPFFGENLALGSALKLLLGPATEVVITGYCIQSTFCCTSQYDWEMVRCCEIREDSTLKWWLFKNFWSAHKAPGLPLWLSW